MIADLSQEQICEISVKNFPRSIRWKNHDVDAFLFAGAIIW
jgi:hypothetical protein